MEPLACGIVCEYDPFHNGHAYQIAYAKETLGLPVVCAMSGDFVQRGEAAIYSKHDRARAAVAGGADLVLELPLPWCMAPAETLARGAVGLLGAAGIVTHLCFGSESGDLPMLEETARQAAARLGAKHLVGKSATAMVDGDMDTVFAVMKKQSVNAEKAMRAKILKETPVPPASDDPNDEKKKQEEAKKLRGYFGLST